MSEKLLVQTLREIDEITTKQISPSLRILYIKEKIRQVFTKIRNAGKEDFL